MRSMRTKLWTRGRSRQNKRLCRYDHVCTPSDISGAFLSDDDFSIVRAKAESISAHQIPERRCERRSPLAAPYRLPP